MSSYTILSLITNTIRNILIYIGEVRCDVVAVYHVTIVENGLQNNLNSREEKNLEIIM